MVVAIGAAAHTVVMIGMAAKTGLTASPLSLEEEDSQEVATAGVAPMTDRSQLGARPLGPAVAGGAGDDL